MKVPNEPLKASALPNCIVTIGDVEEKTGLGFLKSLNKSVEDVVETEKQKCFGRQVYKTFCKARGHSEYLLGKVYL